MTVRGTRNLLGKDADDLADLCLILEEWASGLGLKRFIPSSLVEKSLLENQMGDNRVFSFKDLGDRDLMLLPEVTAVARQEYREVWRQPTNLFYTARCYRYDRPQRGRYREFTQFGIESMPCSFDVEEMLSDCLTAEKLYSVTRPLHFEWRKGVKRGLGYYTGDGFEVWANGLQIAGGGPYAEGAGFALGVERLLLVLKEGSSGSAGTRA